MKEVHTINYYPINEGAARRAKEMNSFSDYKEGSATAEYRAMVDKASSSPMPIASMLVRISASVASMSMLVLPLIIYPSAGFYKVGRYDKNRFTAETVCQICKG